ncbi:putative ABC transport system permease protein [Paucibacter oligotrophus]|uniref:Putative ABC transport system permease protein n=1 Tax=Roseateles oligotrophus TaxID=1769250 RepID=A0A840L2G0_9BURK|nr:ABC transporter permease [Roseateles oligotrophus]MBB4842021.1 putative ABC transport system permease protein [Roseateles oligotrophus]
MFASMFAYYLDLARRSFRRSPGLSVLMVLALGLGIGACMTTLSVYHVLSADPIPSKSARMLNVQLDAENRGGDYKPGAEPTLQLTRYDAETLLREKRGQRQVLMTGGYVPLQAEDTKIKPFFAPSRFASADFFTMFEAPFAYGAGWDAQADAEAARVVVISAQLNERLFGGGDSRGRTITAKGVPLRVIGVLKPWRPVPHYFDLTQGKYSQGAELFLPFQTAMQLRFGSSGNMNCWGEANPADRRALNAPCAWLQYWVELASPADVAGYRDYLQQYSKAQLEAGRFQRPPNARARPVMDWLVQQEVLPADVKLQVWLAFGFLLVCLTNTVGLLLATALRRSGEIGVRRALGATRKDIFAQFLVEAAALGMAGGALGVLLAWGGLWLVRLSPNSYAALAQMDLSMLGLSLLLSLLASVAAGLLPAWRAAGVTPALQLKTQ